MSAVVSLRQSLDLQRGIIGASEAPAAIGVDPWRPPVRLFLEKTGRAQRSEMGAPARWGTILEPIVRGYYVELHGVEVHIPPESLYHPTIPWLRATPDGVIVRGAEWIKLLEVKCPGLRMAERWGTDEDPEVPIWYHVQVVVQMAVTGLSSVDVAALIGGQEYREVTIHRDPDLEASVIDGVSEFKRYLDADELPPLDASEDFRKHLLGKIREDSIEIVATERIDELAVQWRDVVRAKKELDDREDGIKNAVIAELVAANARKVKTSLGKLTVTVGDERKDWQALAHDYASQLQLRGVPVSPDEDMARFTKVNPEARSIRRPTNWSKS